MKKTKTGKQYIQLLTDEEIEKRKKESLILEIEHLDNDNFKFIIDGKKLRENFKKKIFTIDLLKQEQKLAQKLIMLLYFSHYSPKWVRMGIEKQELAELKRSLEEGDNNALKNFIKKQGFKFFEKDIQNSFIQDYFYGLFAIYKNSETPKEDLKGIKKKLRDLLITSLTDKRGAKHIGFDEEKFKNDYKRITKEAKEVYRSVKQFCKDSDCATKNYVNCKKRGRCKHLAEIIPLDRGKKRLYSRFTHYNHPSKYRDAMMCTLYKKSMKEFSYIKSILIDKRNES
jgi:hypothetical protein